MGSLFPSLHGYERSWVRGDLLTGLTVWAVLVLILGPMSATVGAAR